MIAVTPLQERALQTVRTTWLNERYPPGPADLARRLRLHKSHAHALLQALLDKGKLERVGKGYAPAGATTDIDEVDLTVDPPGPGQMPAPAL